MAGHESQILSDGGEGLFQYLAAHMWNARSLPHPQGEGTDSYIYWPDLREAGRLPVQVKTVRRVTAANSFVRLRPSAVESSIFVRPLVVLCETSTARAWWEDTSYWPFAFGTSKDIRISIDRSRPVDETTRKEVQNIAYRRTHRLMITSRSQLPSELRQVTFDSLMGLIRAAESDRTDDVIRRDAVGLVLARLVHASLSRLTDQEWATAMERLLQRITDIRPGGRSHTLGALILLLYNDTSLSSVMLGHQLQRAGRLGVGAGDFIHAEFGLLIAARAVEMKPRADVESLRDLISTAALASRTDRFERVAARLRSWHPKERPVRTLFHRGGLTPHILRQSRGSFEILDRQGDADRAVDHILRRGPASASAEELRLVDQITRLRADHILWNEIGRSTL